MKRKIFFLIMLFTGFYLSAQEVEPKGLLQDEDKSESKFKIGLYIPGGLPVGSIGEYENFSLGLGFAAEYLLPFKLNRISTGLSARMACKYVFLKEKAPMDFLGDVNISAGAFVQLPFATGNLNLMFQPELEYGAVFHCLLPEKNSGLENFYVNQILCFVPSLRFSFVQNMELEFSPFYMMEFEKTNLQHEVGLRLGILFYL